MKFHIICLVGDVHSDRTQVGSQLAQALHIPLIGMPRAHPIWATLYYAFMELWFLRRKKAPAILVTHALMEYAVKCTQHTFSYLLMSRAAMIQLQDPDTLFIWLGQSAHTDKDTREYQFYIKQVAPNRCFSMPSDPAVQKALLPGIIDFIHSGLQSCKEGGK